MTGQKVHSGAQVLVVIVAVLTALSMARSVFAPVAFGLFITALVWPLQKILQTVLPRLGALAHQRSGRWFSGVWIDDRLGFQSGRPLDRE